MKWNILPLRAGGVGENRIDRLSGNVCLMAKMYVDRTGWGLNKDVLFKLY